MGMRVFVCDPRSPRQRGSNENTNRVLRQYVPRQADLDRIAEKVSTRPRRVPGWDTSDDRLVDARVIERARKRSFTGTRASGVSGWEAAGAPSLVRRLRPWVAACPACGSESARARRPIRLPSRSSHRLLSR